MHTERELISSRKAAFLNLRQFPAYLDVEQTAALLGRRPEHIPILVEGGFLEPLGNPPKNGVKLFAACLILEKTKDVTWLNKANKYLTRHWQNRNSKTNATRKISNVVGDGMLAE